MFFRIGLVALVLAVLIGTVVASQSDQARYQFYDRWYPPTFQTEGSVDAVIIGRSGLQTAINAIQFGEEMTRLTGEPFVAIDLSKSWSGVDTHYIQARDVLDNLDVDTLVVQIYPDAAREHEMFFQLARYSDIWSGTFAYVDRSTVERLRHALALSFRKWSEFLATLVSGDLSRVQSDSPVRGSSDPTPSGEAFNADARTAWIEAVGAEWREKPWMLWSLEADYDARNRYFYDQIVALANERGVRLVFLYLPQLYDAPVTQNFVTLIQERYGDHIDFIAPALDDLDWIYENGFADHGHATNAGQQYITAMYAQLLYQVLLGEAVEYPTLDHAEPDTPAAPRVADLSAVTHLEFTPAANGLVMSGGTAIIVPEGAVIAIRPDAERPLFRLNEPLMLTHVFPDQAVGAGETFVVSGDVTNVAGVDPLQLRLIYSRDCSLLPEDYAETTLTLASGATAQFTLVHTFRDSHDCSKLLVQPLNATPTAPAVFELGELSLSQG